MSETLLFCLVFLSQVLLISLFFARRLASRMRYVLASCPPSTHPKLYALPLDWHERRLRIFTSLNRAILVAGLAIIVALILATLNGAWDGAIVTPWSTSGEWDAAIVIPFFMLQMVPLVYAEVSGGTHNKAMAKAGPPPVRTAELRPRQLSDFISPAMLVTAALLYVAFVAFVLYYRRFEFPWFTAAGNIAGVTFINLVMVASIAAALHGRRRDHYQVDQDRLAIMRSVVKGAALAAIAYPVLIATLLTIKAAFGPDTLEPVVASLYVQLAALVMWPGYNPPVDKMHFDVYRGNAQPT
jgi:hypothetical protein